MENMEIDTNMDKNTIQKQDKIANIDNEDEHDTILENYPLYKPMNKLHLSPTREPCDFQFDGHYAMLITPDFTCKNFDDVFTIGKKLGEGAFGEVYEGTNKIYNHKVAIKIQKYKDSSNDSIFKKEIQNLKNFVSECQDFICLEGWGLWNHKIFIAMKYINGITLTEYINQQDIDDKIFGFYYIAKQLIDDVQIIHNKGYAHMDIKPDNILINSITLDIKIVDFGLLCNTNNCSNAGTPIYMSYSHNNTLNQRQKMDWYSLALTLFQLGYPKPSNQDIMYIIDYDRFRTNPIEYIDKKINNKKIKKLIKDVIIKSEHIMAITF
jgi:serine/threonine protein kinase